MSKKKKIFVLAGMVALLVVTGVLNIILNQKPITPIDGGVVSGSYFETTRSDKKATRDETLLVLDAIIANGTEQARADAEAQKLAITNSMTMENNLESLIKALGYDDVVVTASSTYVNVIIKADDLTDIQVAQIVHIITTETTKTPSNIRIIPIE